MNNAQWIGLVRRGAVVVFLGLLVVYFALSTDRFWQPTTLINVLQQNAVTIIVTVGMTLVMISGGIDLSVGSVAAFSGAIAAGVMARDGVAFPVAILLALAVGFLIGLINGALVVFGKLPPFVATLASLGVMRGATLLYTDGRPITVTDDTFKFLGRGTVNLPLLGDVPMIILLAFAVILAGTLLLSQTRFGLHIYAVGGNEETARLAGVNVAFVKLMTYGISGLLAGLAGVLLTARLYSAQPQSGAGLELEAIAASVLGGVSLFGGIGNFIGATIGALLMGVLTSGLNLMRVASYQQQMIQGVVLVMAVALDMFTKRWEK